MIDKYYVHTVTVETFLGTNGYGADMFAGPVDVPCFVDQKRHLVRSGTGAEVISETTVFTNPANAALFTPDSRVTFSATPARVITAALFTSGALKLPDHLVVDLT